MLSLRTGLTIKTTFVTTRVSADKNIVVLSVPGLQFCNSPREVCRCQACNSAILGALKLAMRIAILQAWHQWRPKSNTYGKSQQRKPSTSDRRDWFRRFTLHVAAPESRLQSQKYSAFASTRASKSQIGSKQGICCLIPRSRHLLSFIRTGSERYSATNIRILHETNRRSTNWDYRHCDRQKRHTNCGTP